MNLIYTIGHSNHPIANFIAILQSFDIKTVVDVRSMPGSKRNPHFNSAAFERSLSDVGIKYIHMPNLGGRQTDKSPGNELNTGRFTAYRQHMTTEPFNAAIATLQKIAQKERAAYMCAEAHWPNCHRSLISDFLKASGWDVLHITAVSGYIPHPGPYVGITQGNLFP